MLISNAGLVAMIRGANMSYSLVENETLKQYDSYCGGFNDRWDWKIYKLQALPRTKLLEILKIINDDRPEEPLYSHTNLQIIKCILNKTFNLFKTTASSAKSDS